MTAKSKVTEWIEIQGARTHNLKEITVRIPRNQFVVITGVSGSGKSSLAFDTIFAEGQRRFFQTASPFTRALWDRLPAPDVDAIRGLPPTLSVGQEVRSGLTHRSTLASTTEIHEFLRLLYARCGTPVCPNCQKPFDVLSLREIVDAIMTLPEGEKIHILAPLCRGERSNLVEQFDLIRRESFLRIRLDGVLGFADANMSVDPSKPHDLDLVVDRQVVRAGLEDRLAESMALALRFGAGVVTISTLTDDFDWNDRTYSTAFACPKCRGTFSELEPRTFNPDSPHGACSSCQGLGIKESLHVESLVPGEPPTAIRLINAKYPEGEKSWSAEFRKRISTWTQAGGELTRELSKLTETSQAELIQLLLALDDDDSVDLNGWRIETRCPSCDGERLAPAGRSVRLAGRTLPQVMRMTVREADDWVRSIHVPSNKESLAGPLLVEIRDRLDFLLRVGVGYLELDRPIKTLSGGEAQRVRLASCAGMALRNVCYVLDEPTQGLHPRDVGRLLDVLDDLQKRGSSLIVVEHDESALNRADWIIDLGPRAGVHGGCVVNQGPPESFRTGPGLTAEFQRQERKFPEAPVWNSEPPGWLELSGVRHRHLENITVRFPKGRLSAVTGVSGSGKSSLIVEVLAPALQSKLHRFPIIAGEYDSLTGWEGLESVKVIDQSPIGRSPRSMPATLLGLLKPIRDVFAQTREAKTRGYGPSKFSFTHPSGRCPECKGLGAKKLSRAFSSVDYLRCEECRGKRFSRSTLEIRFRGLTIAEALALTVEEALAFFENHSHVHRTLETLRSLGLGYLRLDQWATTLSGGEAQRLKLAADLVQPINRPTVFLLDEPTSGLHQHDVVALLQVLRKLVEHGHTVIAVEHHVRFIQAVDWVVDLGPEGGVFGGQVLAQGPPGLLCHSPESITGAFLS